MERPGKAREALVGVGGQGEGGLGRTWKKGLGRTCIARLGMGLATLGVRLTRLGFRTRETGRIGWGRVG